MGFNMKDLQKMQQRMMKLQEDLANSTFEGTSGGGAVTVTISGKFEAQAVKIDPEVIDPEDVSILEDLELTAFKDAFEKATAAQAQVMQAITGGIKLPPGMGF
jgi:DNA-binding YbaB/EbfC family protein